MAESKSDLLGKGVTCVSFVCCVRVVQMDGGKVCYLFKGVWPIVEDVREVMQVLMVCEENGEITLL